MQRWPDLALRKGDALAQPRANAVNATNLNNYYNLLEKTLKENDLFNCPNRIYNMDESGLPLDHKPPKVIALRGAKKVHCRTSGNKMQVTVLACASATGMSDKGWTDMELFSHWMKDLFLPNIPSSRPVLLLLDGHSSHYEPDTIQIAAEEGVVIMCLPPHTTHVSQPLDVSFFKPLKTYWLEACHRFMQDNPGRVVTKYQFSSLFATAWYKAIRPETFISGFRKVGVCPFDSTAITAPDVPVNEDEPGGEPSDDEAGGDESDEENNPFVECSLMDDGESHAVNMDGCATQATFTPEQVELFEARYENG